MELNHETAAQKTVYPNRILQFGEGRFLTCLYLPDCE
jgi:hypothetical protein